VITHQNWKTVTQARQTGTALVRVARYDRDEKQYKRSLMQGIIEPRRGTTMRRNIDISLAHKSSGSVLEEGLETQGQAL
jgi:hypothetical protein